VQVFYQLVVTTVMGSLVNRHAIRGMPYVGHRGEHPIVQNPTYCYHLNVPVKL